MKELGRCETISSYDESLTGNQALLSIPYSRFQKFYQYCALNIRSYYCYLHNLPIDDATLKTAEEMIENLKDDFKNKIIVDMDTV